MRILPVDAGAAAFHEFLNLVEGRHRSVSRRGHGQRAVRHAAVDRVVDVSGGHKPVDQARSEAVAAADPVED